MVVLSPPSMTMVVHVCGILSGWQRGELVELFPASRPFRVNPRTTTARFLVIQANEAPPYNLCISQRYTSTYMVPKKKRKIKYYVTSETEVNTNYYGNVRRKGSSKKKDPRALRFLLHCTHTDPHPLKNIDVPGIYIYTYTLYIHI